MERSTLQAKPTSERRNTTAANVQRVAPVAAPSPAQAMQQRLGNQGTQALLARTAPAARSTDSQGAKSPSVGVERYARKPPASDGKSNTAPGKPGATPPTAAGSAATEAKSKTASGPASATKAAAAAGSPGANAHAVAAPGNKAHVAKAPAHADSKDKSKESAGPNAHAAIAPAASAVRQRAAGARKHSGAGVAVGAAQAAAITPAVEQKRSAATQTVATLDSAKAEQVKRDQFKAKLKQAIEAATPKPTSEAQAEKVMKEGGSQASGALRGQLATERDAAAGPLKSASSAEVSAASQPSPPQVALQSEPVGSPPAPVSAAPVVPAPLPPERLDYSSDRGNTDQVMAENNVTSEQLQEGNDPAFGPALAARTSAEKHEAGVEAKYRQGENKIQDQAQAGATLALNKELTGMHGAREQQFASVVTRQQGTKNKDAQERQRITDTINSIKDRARTDVETILTGMDTEASKLFEDGLKRAESAYEEAFEEAKGGLGTWLTTWGSDWDKHIEKSLATARRRYMSEVDKTIDTVAEYVENQLKTAKQRVASGRKEVETFVNGLDASVKQFGEEALQAVSADFDTMASDIDERRDGLINKLTEQYKASYERMSAMENKLREENKSLWQRVYDATAGLIKKIIAFKDMLLGILGKAAAVIGDIIAHPIRFLGNLVTGVMQGLKNFVSNIGTHLKKGLMDWLFGALSGAGLQLPDNFDLKGIISIVLQILGLTYANFRSRAVSIVGEPVVAAIEKTAEVFKVIVTEGVPGLWRFIKDQLANLKSMVLDAIFDFVKEKVIMAGVTWIIGLLNPASAFFKACKAIYDIVMFFINRGSQILALVNAVIDSMAAIANGAVGVAAGFVENALAKAIPVAIGFLAGLLGLGDPSKPVRELIDKARAPVNKAIDWVINLAVKGVKAVAGLVGRKHGEESKKQDGAEGVNVKVQKSFSLPKERHTVSASINRSRLQVNIASDREGDILLMLDAAISEVSADRSRDKEQRKLIVADLRRVESMVKSMGNDYYLVEKQRLDYKTWSDIRLSEIATLLSHLGPLGIRAFSDFHGKPLDKRYLPTDYDVRNKLYLRGSSWSGNRANKIRTGKNEIIADVKLIIMHRTTNLAVAQAAWDRLKFGLRIPDGATMESLTLQHVENTEYEVDHKNALAIHWSTQGGNNSADQDRWALSAPDNLQYITRRDHDKKPKEPEYTRYVGKSFSSIYAEGNNPYAKSIDRQPFLDAPGGNSI